MTPTFQNGHEAFCFENAVHFTTVQGTFQSRVKHIHASWEAAVAFAKAQTGRPVMIYAVTAADNHAHIANIKA